MKDIREQVYAELLPRAFCTRQTTYIWIDPVGGFLGIDSPSCSKAEDVLTKLRQAIEELPVSSLATIRSPSSAMTYWLADGEAPGGFTIDRDCELKSMLEEKSVVRYMRHSLETEEVHAHISAGKLPTRLAMTWNDRLSFVLTNKLEIKRISFLDSAKAEARQSAENAEELFDSDFALMSGEFSRFIPDLISALGGEHE